MLIAAGLRSGTRTKNNWRASGWLEIAEALPEDWTLVALDGAKRPPLSPLPLLDYDLQFLGPDQSEKEFYRHPRVLDRTGETPTLHHAAALLQRCHAFVGLDSGLLHVAYALGKPTVALYAAAPVASRIPPGPGHHGFEGKMACFPCEYRTPCPVDRHCLDYVRGAAVVAKLKELLCP